MASFKFIITSPMGILFSEDVSSVNFKSAVGFLTILANHTNITGIIEETEIKVNEQSIGFAKNGVYRFYNNMLEFVVTLFEHNRDDLAREAFHTKDELKLSNVKKDVSSDILLEIELLKNIKRK